MKEWAVGFLIVMAIIKIFEVKSEGIFAWLMISIFPYGLGLAIYELIGWLK